MAIDLDVYGQDPDVVPTTPGHTNRIEKMLVGCFPLSCLVMVLADR